MPADADAPVLVLDGVVDADVAGVALCLHGVATERASGGDAVARAHEYRVSCVAKMVRARVLSTLGGARMGVGGHRKT